MPICSTIFDGDKRVSGERFSAGDLMHEQKQPGLEEVLRACIGEQNFRVRDLPQEDELVGMATHMLSSQEVNDLVQGLLADSTFTPGQLNAIAYLCDPDRGGKAGGVEVTYDPKCVVAKTQEGSVTISAGVPVTGSGVFFNNFPTGCGKTSMSLMAAFLRVANSDLWRRTCDLSDRQLHDGMRSGQGMMRFHINYDQSYMLFRGVLWFTQSAAILDHWQGQLANLVSTMAGLMQHSEAGTFAKTLDIWVCRPAERLRTAVAHTNGRVTLSFSNSHSTIKDILRRAQEAGPDSDRVTFVIMIDNAQGQKRLRDTTDDVNPTVLFPIVCRDECMHLPVTLTVQQSWQALDLWVVQATLSALAAHSNLSRWDSVRGVITPELRELYLAYESIQKHPGASHSLAWHRLKLGRHVFREAVFALMKVKLCSFDLELRQQVVRELLEKMPPGVEFWRVPCSLNHLILNGGDSGMTELSVTELLGRSIFRNPLRHLWENDVPEELVDVYLHLIRTQDANELSGNMRSFRDTLRNYADEGAVQNRFASLAGLIDRVANECSCPVCFEDLSLECGKLVILSCCSGIMCRECSGHVHRCPFCRVQMSAKDRCPLVMHRQPEAAEGPPTLDELSRRTSGLQTPCDTFVAVLTSFRVMSPKVSRRVLVFVENGGHVQARVLSILSELAFKADIVQDRLARSAREVQKFMADGEENRALVCTNTESGVVGLDLHCVTCIVSLGRPRNWFQLIGRVLRPGGDPEHWVPVIAIC